MGIGEFLEHCRWAVAVHRYTQATGGSRSMEPNVSHGSPDGPRVARAPDVARDAKSRCNGGESSSPVCCSSEASGTPARSTQNPTLAASGSGWLTTAIVAAAILLAGAFVSAAIIIRGNRAGNETAASEHLSSTSVSDGEQSPTCLAWKVTKAALYAIPSLPSGWNWNTPGIETYVENDAAARTVAFDSFEPKIVEDSSDISRTARKYVAAERLSIQRLTDHAYSKSDAENSQAAEDDLNRVCGIE